jgi:ribosomal protein L31
MRKKNRAKPADNQPAVKTCVYCKAQSESGLCEACISDLTATPEWVHEGLTPPRFRVEVCSDNHPFPRGSRLEVEEVKEGDSLVYGEALCVVVDEIVCAFGRSGYRSGSRVALLKADGNEFFDFAAPSGDTRLCRVFSVTLPDGTTIDPNRNVRRGGPDTPAKERATAKVVSIAEWRAARGGAR